jgi:hypothetical protein
MIGEPNEAQMVIFTEAQRQAVTYRTASRTADETTIVRTEGGLFQDMKLAWLQAETNDPTSTSDHGSTVAGDERAPTAPAPTR